ncbi:hypothetical protein B2D07_12500 [Desulfococcus multivorans]|uniref:Uncharacterized protein n=1 Tax=Desulfococcus multivorans DSM 2059 TaxID=1121405 RepID=S7VE55_DESML|nr:hypothetical protein B2D07_12500 [Desulfococcus multivorans]EPR45019.1 hypothetical protein dsmv_3730 [Desulfococcus multivorans DSM 2059]SKA26862.1 hypothetical protein SAMN02745446_03661 [Desulfococcus multivorans DSM 2059]
MGIRKNKFNDGLEKLQNHMKSIFYKYYQIINLIQCFGTYIALFPDMPAVLPSKLNLSGTNIETTIREKR